MKLALITGTGMDSKTLTHILLSKNYHVVMTYRSNSKQNVDEIKKIFVEDLVKHPSSKLNFEFMDITDVSSVRNAIKNIINSHGNIDELYSLAAQSHVGDSFLNAEYTMKASGLAVYYLLECCRELCPNVHFYQASTSELFGGAPENCPFTEKSPFECRSPYSIAKNLAYNWIKYYRQTYNMFACSGFLFNHSNMYRKNTFFIKKVTSAAAQISSGKLDKLLLGNLDHWRDEHFSDFGCEAMWKMLNNPLGPRDYVICNNECHHGTEYLDLAFGYFNLDWHKYVAFDEQFKRPNEVVKLVGSSSLAENEIGWKPNRMPFKNHIDIMCEWDRQVENGEKTIRKDVLSLYP